MASVEKQDTMGTTWSMGWAAVLRAHMQRAGPLACGCSVAGLAWSGAGSRDGGGKRGSGLPTHFLCALRIKPSAQSTVWLTQ